VPDSLPTSVVVAGVEYRTHFDTDSTYFSRRSSVDQTAIPFFGGATESLVAASAEQPAGLAIAASGRIVVEVNTGTALQVYYSDEGGRPGTWLEGA
jgi:hypothetical protein